MLPRQLTARERFRRLAEGSRRAGGSADRARAAAQQGSPRKRQLPRAVRLTRRNEASRSQPQEPERIVPRSGDSVGGVPVSGKAGKGEARPQTVTGSRKADGIGAEDSVPGRRRPTIPGGTRQRDARDRPGDTGKARQRPVSPGRPSLPFPASAEGSARDRAGSGGRRSGGRRSGESRGGAGYPHSSCCNTPIPAKPPSGVQGAGSPGKPPAPVRARGWGPGTGQDQAGELPG